MAHLKYTLKPQDIVILLKIVSLGDREWFHHTLAEDLNMSQSEVSNSLTRSCYAGLIDTSKKRVNRLALLQLLTHGISYVFPQQPGAIVRGIATAHSAPPLNHIIVSNDYYVWPYARGSERGQAIEPLYEGAIGAVLRDEKLYSLLALVDGIRVGRAREKEIAKSELEKLLLHA